MGESKYISTDSCESDSTDSTKASSDESRDAVIEVQSRDPRWCGAVLRFQNFSGAARCGP